MSAVKIVDEFNLHRVTLEFDARAVKAVDDNGPYGITRISFIDFSEAFTQTPKGVVKRKIAAAKKKDTAA